MAGHLKSGDVPTEHSACSDGRKESDAAARYLRRGLPLSAVLSCRLSMANILGAAVTGFKHCGA